MSRQLDAGIEGRARKRYDALVRALEFELVDELQTGGADLYGFSVKIDDWQCLITLRAFVDGVACVSFVGADNLAGVFVKSAQLAKKGELRWKVDRFAKENS